MSATTHPAVKISIEEARGCGYRHAGLYFRGDELDMACGRLPIQLNVCPTCGHGLHPARGWTWVDAAAIIEAATNVEPRQNCRTPDNCAYCPIGNALHGELKHAGLIWVGEKFYPTPHDFLEEARRMGISRRIPGNNAVPKGFIVGQTWILLAHRKAITKVEFGQKPEFFPGIFSIFRPRRIEIVLRGDESDEEIDGYVKRGLTPVIVKRASEEQPTLLDGAVNES